MGLIGLNKINAKNKTEVFTGRGNSEQEAREGAEVRFHTWKLERKRGGTGIEITSTAYNYKRHNDVHCKCELTVTYTLV